MPNFIRLSIHIYPPESVDLVPKEAERIHSSLNSVLNTLYVLTYLNIQTLKSWPNWLETQKNVVTEL